MNQLILLMLQLLTVVSRNEEINASTNELILSTSFVAYDENGTFISIAENTSNSTNEFTGWHTTTSINETIIAATNEQLNGSWTISNLSSVDSVINSSEPFNSTYFETHSTYISLYETSSSTFNDSLNVTSLITSTNFNSNSKEPSFESTEISTESLMSSRSTSTNIISETISLITSTPTRTLEKSSTMSTEELSKSTLELVSTSSSSLIYSEETTMNEFTYLSTSLTTSSKTTMNILSSTSLMSEYISSVTLTSTTPHTDFTSKEFTLEISKSTSELTTTLIASLMNSTVMTTNELSLLSNTPYALLETTINEIATPSSTPLTTSLETQVPTKTVTTSTEIFIATESTILTSSLSSTLRATLTSTTSKTATKTTNTSTSVIVNTTSITLTSEKPHESMTLSRDQTSNQATTISLSILAGILFILFVVFAWLYYAKIRNNTFDHDEPGDIHVKEMSCVYHQKRSENDKIFNEEYSALQAHTKKHVQKCLVGQMDVNKHKNRFADIIANDDTRVLLEGNPTGDYINANFVKGYSLARKFIATQAPTKDTINDFWYMIYVYQVQVIVMLTNLIEKNAERCSLYWPDEPHVTFDYGNGIEVTLKDQFKISDYYKRIFELKCESRLQMVHQYFYPEWPDHDAPSSDVLSILHLIANINRDHTTNVEQQQQPPPIVVHCSAGVGRTGTFITLDACFEQLKKESKINAFKFIKEIREMRKCMVQTLKQYIFIHEALNEYCLYGFTSINSSDLIAKYMFMKERIYEYSSRERLELEFEKLHTNNQFISYPSLETTECCIREVKNHIELRNFSSKSNYFDYTRIQGYHEDREFLVGCDPTINTIEKFIQLVSRKNCQVIVCLNKKYIEAKSDEIYIPSKTHASITMQNDDLHIKVTNLNSSYLNRGNIIKNELEIVQNKQGNMNRFKVTLFILNIQWNEFEAPPNTSILLELVLLTQQLHKENSSILVHSAQASNSSVFIALSILLDQLKYENRIDVCRLVKSLKRQRHKTIETYEQYEFLFRAIIQFTSNIKDSFDRQSIVSHSKRSISSVMSLLRAKLRPDEVCIELNEF